jgi:1-acyl-sn-glycerol-3-phosphate acyltransferase
VPRAGNIISRFIGRLLLSAMGWRLRGAFPNREKFIIAVAPHSSNIDFVLTVGVILSLSLRCSFLAKASLFRFPLSLLMRGFGGIPVDRSSSQGVVEQLTEHFRRSPQMILGITPEGTRRQVDRWRSGFAQIAQAADIPVLPAIIDYRQKCVTFGPLIEDVSNVDETVRTVQTAALQGTPRQSGQAG